MTALTSFIAIILAFVVLIDLAVEKGREPTDKKQTGIMEIKSTTER